MRILILDEWLPIPMDSGKRLRSYELLRRMARSHDLTWLSPQPDTPDMADQARQSQQVAFADAAISLAVQMTVAAVGQIAPAGTPEEQAEQLRAAITRIYPECVALVREARQGLQ